MGTPLIRQPGVAIRRVHALVNPASGGVGPGAAEALCAVLAEFGLDARVSELEPRAAKTQMRAILDAGPDLIVVMGGDGTAGLVAGMCGPAGPLVAPLSGGTMNKLGRALYGPQPWPEALAGALKRGAARWMPGGEVDGHPFYCSAVLGPVARLARAREAVRAHDLGRAWRLALSVSRNVLPNRLFYEFDGRTGHGLAVGLICPTVSRALDEDEGALEAVAVRLHHARAGVRLAFSNLIGDWRDNPNVTVRPCVRGRVWARRPLPAMLDGEFMRLGRQVEIRFRPRAFRALAPSADD